MSIASEREPAPNHRQAFEADDGTVYTWGNLRQLAERRHDDPERQFTIATGLLSRNYGLEAHVLDIADLIDDEVLKAQFAVWCTGKGISLPTTEHDTVFEDDTIEHLDMLLHRYSQKDVAAIHTLQRYRNASEQDQNILMSGTYRMLDQFLGPRRHYYQEVRLLPTPTLPPFPPEVYEDSTMANVLFHAEWERALPIFCRSYDEGVRYLDELKTMAEHPSIVSFIERLQEHFHSVERFHVSGFKSSIRGSERNISELSETSQHSFPAFHQKEFAYRFATGEDGSQDFLLGDTGTMKTGGAVLAMEAVGAKTTIVVCPPSMRDTWRNEIEELYEDDVDIVTITQTSEQNLRALTDDLRADPPRYIIIGYSLLSRLDNLSKQLAMKSFVRTVGVDSIIADEIHIAKEPSAVCTQQLYELSKQLPDEAPRIAMTATSVINAASDIDEPIRFLHPSAYPNSGDFTRAARNDPQLISALLRGKRLMTRWRHEQVLADALPELSHEVIPVPMSPFHQAVYEYVYQDSTIEDLRKREFLRQVSLDPNLIRTQYNSKSIHRQVNQLFERLKESADARDRALIRARIGALHERANAVGRLISEEDAFEQLQSAYQDYKVWSTSDESERFDEDFLVKAGYRKLALWAFYTQPHGVDSLIEMLDDTAISSSWTSSEGLYSSKYKALRDFIQKHLGHDYAKLMIVSGFYQSGVTARYEDEFDELSFDSLYEHLCTWLDHDNLLKIDGTVSLEPKAGEQSERESVILAWRNIPKKSALLSTSRAARLGINLSLPLLKNGEKVAVVHLDPPDTDADIQQGNGRIWRPGQNEPVHAYYFRTTNAELPDDLRFGFIDSGIYEMLEYKRLLAQMIQDGIILTPEEERFMNAQMTQLPVDLYPQTPSHYLHRELFPQIRGEGTKKNNTFLDQVGYQNYTNRELFALYYPEYDAVSLSGQNARVTAEIVKRQCRDTHTDNPTIVSVGAGAAILERTLGKTVVNLDMNGELLLRIKERGIVPDGSLVVGHAESLAIATENADITDASLMIHWTQNDPHDSERARILQELNRITKNGGLVTISVPESYLDTEQFGNWLTTLETHFGFVNSTHSPSGLVRATDYRPETICWIFNLEKVSEPIDGYDCQNIQFRFERVFDIVGQEKRKKQSEQPRKSSSPVAYIPHTEFEIMPPGMQDRYALVYETSRHDVTTDIEQELGSIDIETLTGDQIVAEFGHQVFGCFRTLVHQYQAQGMDKQEAEYEAQYAIQQWANNGGDIGENRRDRLLSEIRNFAS